jgi:hypothetical protein
MAALAARANIWTLNWALTAYGWYLVARSVRSGLKLILGDGSTLL